MYDHDWVKMTCIVRTCTMRAGADHWHDVLRRQCQVVTTGAGGGSRARDTKHGVQTLGGETHTKQIWIHIKNK